MNFETFDLVGPVAVQPLRRGDGRGYFAETFRADLFAREIGKISFVQDNESLSAKAGTVRGLHFQSAPFVQGKLVRCVAGAVFDVAVDIRAGSPSYGNWIGIELSAKNGKQLWVPPGFAHGFCTLESDSVLSYKVTAYYSAECDKGVAWDDPAIGVDWPAIADAETLSPRDRVQPKLVELPAYFTF